MRFSVNINFRYLVLALVVLGTSILGERGAMAQTRLGIHVTQEELNVWRRRMTSGPYKSAGDVSISSPGDWTRIVANKNTFMANPTAGRWAGQTSNSCVQPNGLNYPGHGQGHPIRDAAFYYLVNDTAGDRESVRVAVRDELLAQAATAGTDFSNRTRWCQQNPYGPLIDEDPGFGLSVWLTKYLFAYDYIRSSLTSSARSTLDTWFLNAGTYFVQNMDKWLTAAKFPGRNSDNYSNPTGEGVGGPELKKTHYNGWQTDGWHQTWSNRGSTILRFGALVGIMVNDSYLKNQGKRWVKETIKYATFPDGTIAEFYRMVDNFPDLGWGYSALELGSLVSIADAFARNGDLELYNYSTSEGYNGTAGGPKSLGQMITLFLGHVNGTVVRYGTDQASQNGNPSYQINSVDPISGEKYVDDTNFAQANVYYRSNFNKSIYLRQASGAPAYPSGGGTTPGWAPFTGEWGIYPGVLFMFGQMEGTVSPYSTTGSQLPSISFTSAPNTIAPGQSSVLTWSTSNATSCTASGGWTGSKAISGTQSITPTQTMSYSLSCTGLSGSSTQSTTVTVFGPTANGTIAINAGGSSFTAADGTVYAADNLYTTGATFSTVDTIGNTNASALYQTERYGTFSYAIPVTNGDYTLTLQFAEVYWDASGERVFDVLVEGTRRISNLDIYAVAGKNTAYDVNLPVTVNDGMLNLDFQPVVDNATLSALKLTKASAPPTSPTGLTVLLQGP
jgi:hypothetical protein